jgi:hypothetical protein
MIPFKNSIVRRDVLLGSYRSINYFFRTVLLFVGLAFLLIGLASREHTVSWVATSDIQFLPQGLLICFYGSGRVRLRIYLILRRFWSVGSGFNEYDKEKKQIRIFRWGFPGKNRRFELFYTFSETQRLYLENQSVLLGANLYLVLKEKRKILLTQIGSVNFRSFQEIEYFSTDLARFLQLPLEGI